MRGQHNPPRCGTTRKAFAMRFISAPDALTFYIPVPDALAPFAPVAGFALAVALAALIASAFSR